jgi:hypothetical protein
MHREYFFPVGPVAIFNAQGDGSADGFAVAHAGKDFAAVSFDFLAAAATVAKLAAVEFVIDEIDVDGEGSGQAGDEGEERLSVRFTGSVEAKHGNLEQAV